MVNSRDLKWTGDSRPESFTVSASDLGKSIKNARIWRSKADIQEKEDELVLRPRGEDARRNSERSGDYNLVHLYPEIVDEVNDEYGFLNSPAQEEAVVNQGMSIADTVIPTIDEPIEHAEGSYTAVIYAAENGEESDQAVIREESDGDWKVEVDRPLEEETLEAGELYIESADEGLGNYHNDHFNALMDLAVGRGYNTSDGERNGELLMNNSLSVNKPVEWEKVEKLEFDLVEDDESAVYDVNVVYGDGEHAEQALRYEEVSTYLEGFEELVEEDSLIPFKGLAALTPQGAIANSMALSTKALEATNEAFSTYQRPTN